MAIKGKTKARSRRSVTPGPKPVYVVPKKRLLARRSVQFAILGLLVVAAIAGIAYGLMHEHDQQQAQELQQRLSDTIGSYKEQVTAALTSDVGQPNQTTGFDVTPAAVALIEPLKSGKGVPADAEKTASDAAQSAKHAASTVGAIDTTHLMGGKGFDATTVTTVQDSQTGMVNGLKLYATLKPRIEEAHRDLGGQNASFDRTLARAIVALLETPIVDTPPRLKPKGIGYAYADDRLCRELLQARDHRLAKGWLARCR